MRVAKWEGSNDCMASPYRQALPMLEGTAHVRYPAIFTCQMSQQQQPVDNSEAEFDQLVYFLFRYKTSPYRILIRPHSKGIHASSLHAQIFPVAEFG